MTIIIYSGKNASCQRETVTLMTQCTRPGGARCIPGHTCEAEQGCYEKHGNHRPAQAQPRVSKGGKGRASPPCRSSLKPRREGVRVSRCDTVRVWGGRGAGYGLVAGSLPVTRVGWVRGGN